MTPFVPRVLLVRLGPDRGHVRALRTALREAGMETHEAGARTAPALLAATAVRSQVDVIGISLGHRNPVPACRELRRALAAAGAPDLPLVVSGVVSGSQQPDLARLGVRRIFDPEAPHAEVVRFIEWLVQPKAFVASVLAGAPA